MWQPQPRRPVKGFWTLDIRYGNPKPIHLEGSSDYPLIATSLNCNFHFYLVHLSYFTNWNIRNLKTVLVLEDMVYKPGYIWDIRIVLPNMSLLLWALPLNVLKTINRIQQFSSTLSCSTFSFSSYIHLSTPR